MKPHLFFCGLLTAGVALTSCEDALQEVVAPTATSQQDVRKLPETNALYKAVNIDLQRVEVSQDADDNTSNWTALTDVQPGSRNLLTTGLTASPLLITSEFRPGTVKQIRLVLGTNSTITLSNGRVVELETPSGETSGLKVKIKESINSASRYAVLVTIDPYWQVVARGNGTYSLKPVLDGTITHAWGGDTEARTSR
jgi:hypothetical protein